jgi:esterase/lipase superfamily enzyme
LEADSPILFAGFAKFGVEAKPAERLSVYLAPCERGKGPVRGRYRSRRRRSSDFWEDSREEAGAEPQTMIREYCRRYSIHLSGEMETLIFGHGGRPAIVFPTSGGRFYEFEDRGMVAALAGKIADGQLQLFCVDGVDRESWYNRAVSPRERVQRHAQYERWLLGEVVPLVREKNGEAKTRETGLTALGCSFGGYHAVNLALRHPDLFADAVSICGAFDLSGFLDGYMDRDCYFHLPTYYLPNLIDPWFLERLRRNSIALASGWDDQCLEQNRNLDRILSEKGIPHKFHIWEEQNSHDWPVWRKMVAEYL